jgi:hypothetical protein
MRRAIKSKKMRAVVESYQKSGMGPSKFAAREGLSLHQLKYWIKRLKEEKTANPGFIELAAPLAGPVSCLLEIDYPNGVKVKLRTGDFPDLRQLINLYEVCGD